MQEIFGIFGIDTRLLLIQAFNFGVLLLALWFLLYRPLVAMLEKRRKVIEESVKNAEVIEKERGALQGERDGVLSKASHEADSIVKNAIAKAKEREVELLGEAQEKSERLLREAKARAEEEQRKILNSGKEEIARMAVLGAERVLRGKIKSK